MCACAIYDATLDSKMTKCQKSNKKIVAIDSNAKLANIPPFLVCSDEIHSSLCFLNHFHCLFFAFKFLASKALIVVIVFLCYSLAYLSAFTCQIYTTDFYVKCCLS